MRTSAVSSCRVVLSCLLGVAAVGCGDPGDPDPVRPPLGPDGEPGPSAQVIGAWDALVARSDGPPSVRWSEHGTPMTVYGALSGPRAAVAAGDAWSFLADHERLLRIADGLDSLDHDTSFDSPLGSHFRFAQRYQGVRVHGAEVKLHFDRAGRVIGFNNSAVPELALDTRPAISAERARALALAAAPARDPDADPVALPELVIYTGAGAPALAYRAVVATGGPTLELFVGAKAGALLGEPTDLNRYVDGTGQVFKDNAVVATQNNNLVDSRDAASAVPAGAYSLVTLPGLVGNNRLDGQFASGASTKKRAVGSNNTFNFLRNTVAFSETMAYFHFDFAQRYIQSLGFTNVNNRQQVFAVDRLSADNSFYSPSNRQISLGTGGVDDAEDGEVIVHEYGHSVQDNQVPGFGASQQGGAMGEGFGDYLAATVNASLTGGFQIECIAEWDATSYAAGVPHCLRRLDSTKHFPEDANGSVHDDGEMWSASLFQIRNALGATKADRLIIQAHFLLAANANFRDGSNALVTAAINLGLSSAEVSAVRSILLARGFTVTA